MNSRQKLILGAAMLVTLVTGSIHGFSVFLIPLENLLQLPRAKVSLLYSFCLMFLTLTVLLGYRIYNLAKPAYIIIAACAVAGAGLLISARSTSWWSLFLGYSVLFGSANGIGYGYVLQLVGRSLASFSGFSMAAVTAAYAVGSVVFSLVLAQVVETHSLAAALSLMAWIIILSGVLAGLIMQRTGASYSIAQSNESATPGPATSVKIMLWLAYGSSVFAGLMAIGHAAGIVQSLGGEYSLAKWGAVFIGIGSSAGGFLIGTIVSSRNMGVQLITLPLLSAVFLGLLSVINTPQFAIATLSLVGFVYGAIIAIYPYAISVYFGAAPGPKIYGQIFTAWGFAGLAGPWTAGKLFDYAGNYSTALLIAAITAVGSSAVVYITTRKLKPE